MALMAQTGEAKADPAKAARSGGRAREWAGLLVPAGLLIYSVVTASGVQQYSEGGAAIAGYGIVAAFSAVLAAAWVSMSLRGARLRVNQIPAVEISDLWFWIVIALMAALAVAVLPFAHQDGFFLGATLTAPLVGRLGSRSGLPVAAIALISLVVPSVVPGWHTGLAWIQALDIIFTALVTYAFIEVVQANRALVEARAEIARLASQGERNRIARDLHDLLGHSLTAITVKAGLAHRLAMSDPARSAQEIGEVEELSRQALADVRAAVSTYRNVTLAAELARGRELLRASGVMADLPTATDMVDAAHQEVLAWAVREGLTNVARHAHATRCTVLLSASEVEIRDDGVGGPGSDGGHGLAGLRERVAAAGGSVEAGPLSPRGWRLRVSLAPAAGGKA